MLMESLIRTMAGKDIVEAPRKERRQVFGRYLYEGELGILFGDSNTGKSILANDMAFFVCGGGHEWPGMESPRIPTVYIDMEMTEGQYADRYRGASSHMTGDFHRMEVTVAPGTDGLLFPAIRKEILLMQKLPNPPKFIIIDNISNGFGSVLSASKMRALMSEFKSFKDRFGMTMLVIAHCPKRKAFSKITDNSLGGTKMLLNLCDSAFAIAPSIHGPETKYLKQIKTRAGEKTDEVMTLAISRDPYLCMVPQGMTEENAHLQWFWTDPKTKVITPENEIEIVRLTMEGMQPWEIAEGLGLDRLTVSQFVKREVWGAYGTNTEDT